MRPRSGYTLMELVISMFLASFVLIGTSSAIFLASSAVEQPDVVRATREASDAVYDLADELRFAVSLPSRSARMVRFSVEDIDGDGTQDVVQYEWSGVAGAPLTRSFNGDTPVAVLANVQEFNLTYHLWTQTEQFADGLVESSTVTLAELLDGYNRNDFAITSDSWAGQYFAPALPANAQFWKPTRVRLELRRVHPNTGQFKIQLRPATGDGTPTSTVREEVLVNESSLNNSYRWKEYTFRNATLLTPSQRLCIVVPQVSGGTAGEASYEDAGITLLDHAMLVSDNQGATWSIASDKALHFRVRGTYFTPSGSLHTVTRNYVTGIQVTLRTGAGGESRVISQIPLLNSPEFLAGFWKLDFNEDPRSVDYNCDGLGDWTENTGSNGFDPESLVDGVWQANAADQVALRTQPNFDFTSLTTVEVRCRSTSFNASGYGAHFLIHVDRSGSTSGVIFTSVRLEANGSQSARVYVKPDADTETTIAEVTGLSTAFVEFRLVIDPSVDLVAVWINDTYRSTWQYQRFVNTNDHFFLAQASESNAEFDYISVRAN